MANIYSWSGTPGSNATQGDINFAEGQAPSTLNGSSRVLMSDVAKWRDLISGAKISATADTMTLTSGASVASYAQGTLIAFECGATNTTAVTINVDSLGAKAIVKNYNVPLIAGDLVAGGIYIIAYEATAANFQLLSPGSRQQATLVGAETLTNKTLTSAVLNTGVSGSAFLDEDNLASNSATKLASQQSLKTYIDAAASSVDATGAAASAVTAANYAVKVDGVAADSDHSSKAWAVGGTGITDTSSKGAAKEWATEAEDNTVAGAGTYSALHYSAKATASASTASTGATTSTNYATKTDAAISSGVYSSKEHAIGVQSANGGSSKQWALGGGGSYTVGTVVSGSDYSAKYHAAAAATSAAVAATGQIYSTVVNQTGAAISPALSADGTYYLCDTSSNNITVTLPAIGTSEGVKYAFQKTHASNSLIFARSGSDTLNGSASNITITDVNAQIQFVSDNASPDNWVGVNLSQITVGSGLSKTGSVVSLDLTTDQSWTGSQRSTPVANTSGSFDMATGNNFNYTPSGNQALTFTNITAGQGGILYVVNSGHTITKHASVKVDANLLATVTAAGTYMLGYYAPTAAIIVVTNTLAVT